MHERNKREAHSSSDGWGSLPGAKDVRTNETSAKAPYGWDLLPGAKDVRTNATSAKRIGPYYDWGSCPGAI